MILNREIEITKQALWSPGTYRRALGYFQTLKLKSGGWRIIFAEFTLIIALMFTAHLLQHRQHQTHHRQPPSILDHRIKDYRHRVRPRAVFIQNQLQESPASLQRVDIQRQFTLMWEEQSIHRRWKH